MQSRWLRRDWEDGENVSPSPSQRGSKLEYTWHCGLKTRVQVQGPRFGQVRKLPVWDQGTPFLLSILYPSSLFFGGAALNLAPMAWLMGFPSTSGVRIAGQSKAASFSLVVRCPPHVWGRILKCGHVVQFADFLDPLLCSGFDYVTVLSCLPECRAQREKDRGHSLSDPGQNIGGLPLWLLTIPSPPLSSLCPGCPAAPPCFLPVDHHPYVPRFCRPLVMGSPAT